MTGIAFSIVKYAQRTLSNVHLSAVKTISLLLWAMSVVREPNLSEWARRLRLYQAQPDGTIKPYSFEYKKFRIWRFLTRSVVHPDEIWEAITHQWLDPHDAPEQTRPLFVTLDWTQLGSFRALVLALPYHGRAIPLAVTLIAEGFLENEMTRMEIDLVQRFLGWLSPTLRSRLVILADRGFAKVELFNAIEAAGASYVIRLPRTGHIRVDGQWLELGAVSIAPGETLTYSNLPYTQEHQKPVNLAVRRLPVGKAHDPTDDTWCLATNRPEVSRAPDGYALRFKEEELFRDWKSVLDAARHRLQSEEGLAKLVALLGLYYVFVVLEGQVKSTPERLRQVTRDRRNHPELGIFRQALAVLLLWASEVGSPPLDPLMARWVQVHG